MPASRVLHLNQSPGGSGEARGFNKAQRRLAGYTSLRAAILALAHACGYPDAELPEGWQ